MGSGLGLGPDSLATGAGADARTGAPPSKDGSVGGIGAGAPPPGMGPWMGSGLGPGLDPASPGLGSVTPTASNLPPSAAAPGSPESCIPLGIALATPPQHIPGCPGTGVCLSGRPHSPLPGARSSHTGLRTSPGGEEMTEPSGRARPGGPARATLMWDAVPLWVMPSCAPPSPGKVPMHLRSCPTAHPSPQASLISKGRRGMGDLRW